MTPRLLFHCASRRGLGHVMRAANLARAVSARDPRASVLVYVTNPAAGPACGDVPWVACGIDGPGAWARVVAAFRPTLTIFDTMLPDARVLDDAGARTAFVWRASVAARQSATAADRRLSRMAAILVPHTAEEFAMPIPAAVRARTVFTGPIVRASDAEGQARVRARYGLAADDVLVTSTVGGGGFDDSADWLHGLVVEAHQHWLGAVPRLRHVVVRGPLAPARVADAPPALPGLTLVTSDPDLVHLLAVSTLVVAEAGYNTIQELRLAGTPAVLVPGPRTFDDQQGRAGVMAALGVARVADRTDRASALRVLLDALQPEALAAMRRAGAQAPFTPGNDTAARTLLAAAS